MLLPLPVADVALFEEPVFDADVDPKDGVSIRTVPTVSDAAGNSVAVAVTDPSYPTVRVIYGTL